MPENTTRDTVILGSGCSGLTAAIYAARANLKPIVLEGHEPGGQLSITTLVENFPGWPEGIQGPELIENMKKQAVRFGAELKMAHLSSVDLTKHPISPVSAMPTAPELIAVALRPIALRVFSIRNLRCCCFLHPCFREKLSALP